MRVIDMEQQRQKLKEMALLGIEIIVRSGQTLSIHLQKAVFQVVDALYHGLDFCHLLLDPVI